MYACMLVISCTNISIWTCWHLKKELRKSSVSIMKDDRNMKHLLWYLGQWHNMESRSNENHLPNKCSEVFFSRFTDFNLKCFKILLKVSFGSTLTSDKKSYSSYISALTVRHYGFIKASSKYELPNCILQQNAFPTIEYFFLIYGGIPLCIHVP